ncbi:lipase family protein [Nostoc parmelioides]|uniref:Lipase family protein n=1 Tax=Nostoc parmelioides FACHB-3921 TaxID=2692909 RepID=A0ABR8BNQ8_9NOSO|nr:lipase family protein [Nostoc parmelioides]MBD2254939.1 lipase family protein [Nostoc parmelioides FACHB-3921]
MNSFPLSPEQLELSMILAQASYLTYSNSLDANEIREKAGILAVKFFHYSAAFQWSIVGFLGCYKDYIIVAFRGTNNTEDWKKNLQFSPNSEFCVQDGSGSRVHTGFSKTVHEGWKDFLVDLQYLIKDSFDEKDWKILLTGHSLGGALAVLTAYRLNSLPEFRSRVQAVYTYGAPRVGDQTFKNSFRVAHYRFEYGNDPIPTLPLMVSGYRHTGERFYLPKNEPNIIRKESQGIQGYKTFVNFAGGAVNLILASRNIPQSMNQLQTGLSSTTEGFENIGDHNIERYISHIQGCNQFSVIVQGLQDGSLKRIGGTIRETKTDRIVGHLFESLEVTNLLMNQPSAPILGGGLFAIQGSGQGVPMQISQVASIAGILNLGVSVAGFVYINYKLTQIQTALDTMQKTMEAGFNRIEERLDSLSGQLAYIQLLVENSVQEQQRLGQAISELHRTVLIQEMASLQAEIQDRIRYPDTPIQNALRVASRVRRVMADQTHRVKPTLDAQIMLMTDIAIQGWAAAIAVETYLLLDSGQIVDAKQILDFEVPRFRNIAMDWASALIDNERPQLATAYRFSTTHFEEDISIERVERIVRISRIDRLLSNGKIQQKKEDAELIFQMTYAPEQYGKYWTHQQIAVAEYLDALSELLARLESLQAFATLCESQGVKSSRELLPETDAEPGLYVLPVELRKFGRI